MLLTVFALAIGAVFYQRTPSAESEDVSVHKRLLEFRGRAEAQWKPLFLQHNISFPPQHVSLILFKRDKKLFLYAGKNENETQLLKTYRILGSNERVGPKLNDSDKQIPEGIYKLASLNPGSSPQLALKIDFPNDFDRRMAEKDSRDSFRSQVLVHSGATSDSNVALKEQDMEELYTLASISEVSSWRFVFAPFDLRIEAREIKSNSPQWIDDLDQQLMRELMTLPLSSL